MPATRVLNKKYFLIAGFIAASLCAAGSVSAQNSQPDLQELRRAQQQLSEQLEKLQSENKQLQQQIQTMGTVQADQQKQLERQPLPEPVETDTAKISEQAAEEEPVEVGYNKGGGGFFIRTEEAQLRILGYVQALGAVYDGSLNRSDGNGEFDIRRARLDFIVDFSDKFQAFVEIDGGPGSTPGGSDFGLIVATGNWKIFDDDLQLLFGKIITPFNNEDTTSSRSIDTIERGVAINSLFVLPATDAQFGVETHGALGAKNEWIYRLGIYNGNGQANDNIDEDNEQKEIQARLNYVWSPELITGLALDFTSEEEQLLTVFDLGFSAYLSIPVKGSRRGVDVHFEWRPHPWHLTGEFLALQFDGNENPAGATSGGVPLIAQNDHINFYGGYIQPSYFIQGNHSEGVELLFRAEGVTIDAETGGDGDTLYAGTLGLNWFISPNTRLQVNAIGHYFNGPSAIRGFDDSEFIPLLLTEMQFKF